MFVTESSALARGGTALKQLTAPAHDIGRWQHNSPPPQLAVPVGKRIRATAESGLSGGGVWPELAIELDSALEESTDLRRHLASEGWPART